MFLRIHFMQKRCTQILVKFVPRGDNKSALVQVIYRFRLYLSMFLRIHFMQKRCCQFLVKFVPRGDNKSALVQVMAWCQKGNKPLLEPMHR